jgi:hypothetical protein
MALRPFDDAEMHVGFEQRHADLAQRGVRVFGRGSADLVGVFLDRFQSFCKPMVGRTSPSAARPPGRVRGATRRSRAGQETRPVHLPRAAE